jgi:hypothetical protein
MHVRYTGTTKVKKVIFKVPLSNKTICDKKDIQRSQKCLCTSWSQSSNSDLWPRGAEINI